MQKNRTKTAQMQNKKHDNSFKLKKGTKTTRTYRENIVNTARSQKTARNDRKTAPNAQIYD